jgi:hypothetical protein
LLLQIIYNELNILPTPYYYLVTSHIILSQTVPLCANTPSSQGKYLSILVGDLNDSWASGDSIVVDGIAAAREDNVALTVNTGRHNNGETTSNWGSRNENGPSDGDKCTVDRSLSVSRSEYVAWGLEGDSAARLDGASGAQSEGWESTDGESRVGGGAADDESSGQGVDLVEVKGVIERLGEGGLAESRSDVGVVAGLDGEDRASISKVGWVGDGGSGAEVGSDTDTLEDGGEADEGLGVGGGEVVGALGSGGGAKGLGEEGDVSCFVRGDFHQVGVEGVREAGGNELGLGVVGQTLTVELILEVLEGKSIVKDVD